VYELRRIVVPKVKITVCLSDLCSALGAVALNDKLFVCGGYDGVSSLNSVEAYDPTLDQWTMISSMEKHRSAAGVVVVDDQIYAIGGHDGLSIFDSVKAVLCSELFHFVYSSRFSL
jgi:kelch-like protein 18